MQITPIQKLFISIVFLVAGCISAMAAENFEEIPTHLALARELVDHIKPEDNRYMLGGRFIRFPGDLFSNSYSLNADCSGFLLALFERAKYPTESMMAFQFFSPGRRRFLAEDFVFSIENEKGFTRIRKVKDIHPGDLLAHAMLNAEDKKQTGTTGHVFLLNSFPEQIESKNPVVDGTIQFRISVIDSNEEYVGADDSRLVDSANKLKGLGKGTIRIYADSNGELVGWARTFKNTNRFFSYDPRFPSDTKLRKAAIGRAIMNKKAL
jgi:hypothetical protein